MILYRAMSRLELAKYLCNIKISPLLGLPSKNSWKKNVLCFFGTAHGLTMMGIEFENVE